MVLLWICLILANVFSQQLKQDYRLRFSQQDTFKIVQFTDTHFGENDSKDIKSQKVLRDIIRWEKPDLVVVTGDVVSDYAWDKKTRPWMAQRYDRFAKIMEEENVWWATAMGNHDFGTDLTMHEVLHLDMSYPHSLTQQNSHKLSRDFTYMLPVYDSKGSSIQLRLWFLNTGQDNCLGKGGWDCPNPDQVKWFRERNFEISKNDPSKGRGFAFMHIPIPEYVDLYNNGRFFGNKNEKIACGSVNTGLFAAMLEQPTVNWVTCGHDHNNDFYGDHYGIYLAFGRKTGYGGYGPIGMQRGARVFEVSLKPFYNIDTWVREESGSIERNDIYRSRQIFEPRQTLCNGILPKVSKASIAFSIFALANVVILFAAEFYLIHRNHLKLLY